MPIVAMTEQRFTPGVGVQAVDEPAGHEGRQARRRPPLGGVVMMVVMMMVVDDDIAGVVGVGGQPSAGDRAENRRRGHD